MKENELRELGEYISSLSVSSGEDVALYHFTRTTSHIARVREFHQVLIESSRDRLKGESMQIGGHDLDKLTIPTQVLPYCLINWKYRCSMKNVAWDIPDAFKLACHEAMVNHVSMGMHHPEYWDPNPEGLISFDDRDGVSRVIDGTRMPAMYVREMAADICAVAYERKNSPMSWVKKNLWTRWNLSPEGAYELIHSVNAIVQNADVTFFED